MILADQVHLGQRVTVRVEWMDGALSGRVIYIHPYNRYFTVLLDCGVRESYQLADPRRLAHRAAAKSTGQKPKEAPKGATAVVCQALKENGITATDVSRALGYNKCWLNIRIQRGIPDRMQDQILQTIRALADKKRP